MYILVGKNIPFYINIPEKATYHKISKIIVNEKID